MPLSGRIGNDAVNTRAYLALAGAGSLWGTGFLFGKIALTQLDVPHMIMYRLSIAACGFAPIVLRRRLRIERTHWPLVLVAAIAGVPLLFLIQFKGIARTTVSHASLMVGTAPILLALCASLFVGERVDGRRWVLLVASCTGALLILTGAPPGPDGHGPTIVGDLLVIASLFAAVVWVLTCKRLLALYPSTVVSAVVTITGTIVLDVWVLATTGAPPMRLSAYIWLALLAQGLFATTTATLLWNWGVARVPAADAGVFVNLEPLLGAVLGVLVLGETLGWNGVAGGVLIVGAAFAMTRLRTNRTTFTDDGPQRHRATESY